MYKILRKKGNVNGNQINVQNIVLERERDQNNIMLQKLNSQSQNKKLDGNQFIKLVNIKK